VIDTNVTGTIYLAQLVGRAMRSRGQGRILFTGSIAGFMPGTYQAVYNATKAFVDSFSFALRAELKDTGVTGPDGDVRPVSRRAGSQDYRSTTRRNEHMATRP
jgi:NADP-dependent 3-hydroxy acid dehydrogenase YdfG